jgi:hypothetical protein
MDALAWTPDPSRRFTAHSAERELIMVHLFRDNEFLNPVSLGIIREATMKMAEVTRQWCFENAKTSSLHHRVHHFDLDQRRGPGTT